MITGGASPFIKDGNNILSSDYCSDEVVKSRILSFAEKKKVGLKSNKNDMVIFCDQLTNKGNFIDFGGFLKLKDLID